MFRKGSPQEISHEYVEERLSGYIDGRLPEMERVQVRKHLQSCSRCQASLDTLGWTVRLLKQIPPPDLPRQFLLPVPDFKRAPAQWLKWGLAAASATAALAFVFFLTLDILSQRGGFNQTAIPAAAPVPQTFVAAVAPTSAPAGLKRAAAPTAAPPPEQPTALPPIVNDSAQLMTPAPSATSAALTTLAPKSLEVQTLIEPASPTESKPSLASKSAPPSQSCQDCGGGIGGGPSLETTQTNAFPSASSVVVTGTVKESSLAVSASPTDKAPRIGLLAREMQVQVIKRDESGAWLQIVFPPANDHGLTGWVATKSITLPVSSETLPTEGTPTETPTVTPTETSTETPTETPTATPAPPQGMAFNGPQDDRSSPAAIVNDMGRTAAPPPAQVDSPSGTSPPTALATSLENETDARKSTPNIPLQSTLIPAHPIESPLSLGFAPQPVIGDKNNIRLAEIASLLISVFAAGAGILIRTW